VSLVNRVLVVAALAAASVAATAHATTPPRTPAATVRAYVAALAHHDAAGACALTDPSLWEARRPCRTALDASATIRRARLEPGGLTRGTRARVVVDLVGGARATGRLSVSRTRVLLHRIGGRWRIAKAGAPLTLGRSRHGAAAPDPAPAGTTAALRRLADDELLTLSGNAELLCGLLASGAPLAGTDSGCVRVALTGLLDGAGVAVRLTRLATHVTAPGRARLDAGVVVTWAVRSARRPGYRLRTLRWSDVLFAVRSGGRWRLVKPSRSFYRVAGVPAPADVGSSSGGVEWPDDDASVPSLSQRAVPRGCQTPPPLWAMTCRNVDGLASGAGLVAWSAGYTASARPVAGGAAAGPVTAVAALDPHDRRLWSVAGVAAVGDGALVIEEGFGDAATRAVPVTRDGRPRGPARLVDAGVADDDGRGAPAVVPSAPGDATATVVTATRRIVRLGADGRIMGPAGALPDGQDLTRSLLVARLDGTFLWFGAGDGGGLTVTLLDASGNPLGAPVARQGGASVLSGSLAAAQDAAGHVLVGWVEEGDQRRRTLRTWTYDPSAPASTAPVTRVSWAGPSGSEDDSDADRVDVSALPDGGWSVAWSQGSALWAAGLVPSGVWRAPPRRVATAFSTTLLQRRGFGLTGDTVAWIAPPAVAGLPQVRSAPLP
jgi:hypothetical protein